MDNEIPPLDSNLLLEALMENTTDSIYFKDRYCRLIRVSRKMANDLGYRNPEELVGKSDADLFGEEIARRTMIEELRIMETGQPLVDMVESRLRPDGTLNWTSTTKFPVRAGDGRVVGLVGITREINEFKRVEADLQYLATHDLLTQLPNRYLFLDRLEQSILRAVRQSVVLAVLYVELSGFRQINERYGHDVGDKVMKEMATRMREIIRRSDTVARMEGDEFVISLESIQDVTSAQRVAQRIQQSVRQPIAIGPISAKVKAFIGISMFPEHAADAHALLKAASDALGGAKKNKTGRAVFVPPLLPSH